MSRNWLVLAVLFVVPTLQPAANALVFSNSVSGVSRTLSAAAYGLNSSNFVVVGTNGALLNSRLGTNAWAQATLPTANGTNFAAATYVNGRFVVGGQNSIILSSTNGVNWTTNPIAFPVPTPPLVTGLAFNTGSNGTVVAVANRFGSF